MTLMRGGHSFPALSSLLAISDSLPGICVGSSRPAAECSVICSHSSNLPGSGKELDVVSSCGIATFSIPLCAEMFVDHRGDPANLCHARSFAHFLRIPLVGGTTKNGYLAKTRWTKPPQSCWKRCLVSGGRNKLFHFGGISSRC